MKEKLQTRARRRATTSRDAVETAIDLAKQDNKSSWAEQIAQDPQRITPWEEKRPETCPAK
jgi:hypothetical protein